MNADNNINELVKGIIETQVIQALNSAPEAIEKRQLRSSQTHRNRGFSTDQRDLNSEPSNPRALSIVERNLPDLPACLAAQPVDLVVAGDRIDAGPLGSVNPTAGALEISPERRLKIEKALRRAARQIALRLYCRLPYLYFLQFRLEILCAFLRMKRKTLGFFDECRRNFHLRGPY